ncbi:MAG: hypothetical protein ACRCXC_02485 [Legionella sp.]
MRSSPISTSNVIQGVKSFCPEIFGEDTSTWSVEEKHNVIFWCIQLGYFSIAKVLLCTLWLRNTAYDPLLITEILMQAIYSPNQASDLILFLIEKMGFNLHYFEQVLIQIPVEKLPVVFGKRFDLIKKI